MLLNACGLLDGLRICATVVSKNCSCELEQAAECEHIVAPLSVDMRKTCTKLEVKDGSVWTGASSWCSSIMLVSGERVVLL
jgi:hypothetical protein